MFSKTPPGTGLSAGGGFEIEIACERVPASAQLAPFCDPKPERIRA